jgi:ISXO2 transposase-like protein
MRRGGRYAGRLRLEIVPNRGETALRLFVEAAVVPGAMIIADAAPAYASLGKRGYAHLPVVEGGDPDVAEEYLPIVHPRVCMSKPDKHVPYCSLGRFFASAVSADESIRGVPDGSLEEWAVDGADMRWESPTRTAAAATTKQTFLCISALLAGRSSCARAWLRRGSGSAIRPGPRRLQMAPASSTGPRRRADT